MKQWFTLVLSLLGATCLLVQPASAVVVADYVGFGWEDGGLPPSDVGDELFVTAVATNVAPLLGLDLNVEEVTVYAYGLVSTGGIIDGFGNLIIDYTGGWLEMYRDPAQNADWGIFPPNATSPSTFMDGSLLFQGAFMDFRLVIQPSGAGAYSGTLDAVGGSILTSLCSNCAYTWGGAFTDGTGAQIPDGYDLQVDGELDVELSVATRPTNFSRIKAMYN